MRIYAVSIHRFSLFADKNAVSRSLFTLIFVKKDGSLRLKESVVRPVGYRMLLSYCLLGKNNRGQTSQSQLSQLYYKLPPHSHFLCIFIYLINY